MKISNSISVVVINTAVNLLQNFIPDLTPTSLIAAIKAYDKDKASIKDRSKRLYCIAEICEILMVTRQSVYNLINSEKLVRIKIGAATRITADSLERFIDGSTE